MGDASLSGRGESLKELGIERILQADRTRRYVISGEYLSFEVAVERARALLQKAGYWVLSEIDVKAKLQQKLGIEREPYLKLGACNPPLANQGLDAEPDLSAFLPCNVAVYERETLLSIVDKEALLPIAKQVREDLSRVIQEPSRSD